MGAVNQRHGFTRFVRTRLAIGGDQLHTIWILPILMFVIWRPSFLVARLSLNRYAGGYFFGKGAINKSRASGGRGSCPVSTVMFGKLTIPFKAHFKFMTFGIEIFEAYFFSSGLRSWKGHDWAKLGLIRRYPCRESCRLTYSSVCGYFIVIQFQSNLTR